MAISISKDKRTIKAVLDTDPYLIDYLGFAPKDIYTVRATDELLGFTDQRNKIRPQIFIYNVDPERTRNGLEVGLVYQVDVSVSNMESGTADLAIDQIQALLDGRELSVNHMLQLQEGPTTLSSETSLYQVGMRFVTYVSKINQIQTYVKPDESEETL